MMTPEDQIADLRARVQFLVDHWPAPLEDGCLTFPDGEAWEPTKKIVEDKC